MEDNFSIFEPASKKTGWGGVELDLIMADKIGSCATRLTCMLRIHKVSRVLKSRIGAAIVLQNTQKAGMDGVMVILLKFTK
jgi:hypothetical protein